MKAMKNTNTVDLQSKNNSSNIEQGSKGLAIIPPAYQIGLADQNPIIQPKLTIGQPNDRYEKEADAVADQVVRMISSNQSADVQAKCQQCNEEDQIQRKESLGSSISSVTNLSGGQSMVDPGFAQQLNQQKGGGHPLPSNIQSEMEGAFGVNFDGVRIHQDSQADQLNQQIGAKAFTNGQDIFFRGGEYEPNNIDGKRLLGHELVHVVQQKASGKNETSSAGSKNNSLVQREIDVIRIDSRPISILNDDFFVPSTKQVFNAALRGFIDDYVSSDRVMALANDKILQVVWDSFQRFAGSSIVLEIELIWGLNRVESLRFILPGNEVFTIRGNVSSEGQLEQTEINVPNLTNSVGEINREAMSASTNPIDRLVFEGASRWLGGALTGARIATIFSQALQAFETAVMISSLFLTSFNLIWAVFTVFKKVHGKRAAGLALVDFCGMLTSWILNNPNANTHQSAIEFVNRANIVSDQQEIYLDALRTARINSNETWSSIRQNQNELQRLRRFFQNNPILLQEVMLELIKREIDDRWTLFHLAIFFKFWKQTNSFLGYDATLDQNKTL